MSDRLQLDICRVFAECNTDSGRRRPSMSMDVNCEYGGAEDRQDGPVIVSRNRNDQRQSSRDDRAGCRGGAERTTVVDAHHRRVARGAASGPRNTDR